MSDRGICELTENLHRLYNEGIGGLMPDMRGDIMISIIPGHAITINGKPKFLKSDDPLTSFIDYCKRDLYLVWQ
tara:strand:+ start:1194 stop:1415 length:222 start_codon:yes stop_codon:yes gene_type:complete